MKIFFSNHFLLHGVGIIPESIYTFCDTLDHAEFPQ